MTGNKAILCSLDILWNQFSLIQINWHNHTFLYNLKKLLCNINWSTFIAKWTFSSCFTFHLMKLVVLASIVQIKTNVWQKFIQDRLLSTLQCKCTRIHVQDVHDIYARADCQQPQGGQIVNSSVFICRSEWKLKHMKANYRSESRVWRWDVFAWRMSASINDGHPRQNFQNNTPSFSF